MPSLRELRPISKIVAFKQQSETSRIVDRLRFICKKEGVNVETTALSTLVQRSDGDIRSCLNTLQFMRKKKKIEGSMISERYIKSETIGHKDVKKGLYDIWIAVFHQQSSRHSSATQKRKRNPDESHLLEASSFSSPSFSEKSQAQKILSMLSSDFGSVDKAIEGCFENYVNVMFNDPDLKRTVSALDFLAFTDNVKSKMLQNQNYSLLSYIPYAAVGFHLSCQSIYRPDHLRFPNMDRDGRMKAQQSSSIVRSLLLGMEPKVFRNYTAESKVMQDLVPYLPRILVKKERKTNHWKGNLAFNILHLSQ